MVQLKPHCLSFQAYLAPRSEAFYCLPTFMAIAISFAFSFADPERMSWDGFAGEPQNAAIG